jgi:hypothetical protein
MGGWEFLDYFTQICRIQNIKVVVLSSTIDPEDLENQIPNGD